MNNPEKNSHPAKREREESPENRTPQTLRSVRKKTLKFSNNVESKESFVPQARGEKNATNPEKNGKTNENFELENDSDLLNDLMADFSDIDSSNTKNTDLKNHELLRSRKNPIKNIVNGVASQDSALGLELEFDGQIDDFFDEDFHDNTKAINLEEFRRCKVIKVEREKRQTKLVVKDSIEQTTATVFCSGFW